MKNGGWSALVANIGCLDIGKHKQPAQSAVSSIRTAIRAVSMPASLTEPVALPPSQSTATTIALPWYGPSNIQHALHAVEDERHVLFVLYYDSIRLCYATLYEAAEGSVQQLMTHANQRRVAFLIHAIDEQFRT